MKKIFTSILIALIATSCMFAGEGKGIRIFKNSGVTVVGNCTEKGIDFSEFRNMDSFDRLAISGPFNVYYVQSDESKVLVEGRKEDVEKLITKVSGSTLTVKLQDGRYNSLVLRVTVYSPDIVSVSKSGSGNFIDDKGHKSNSDLSYSSSGSGIFKIGVINCGDFDFSISGSGRIEAESLKCKDASFRISGSGNVDIENFYADGDVDLRISGSGRMELNGEVTGVVDASISGSGNISGKLATGGLESHISGSGSVRFNR